MREQTYHPPRFGNEPLSLALPFGPQDTSLETYWDVIVHASHDLHLRIQGKYSHAGPDEECVDLT